MNNNLERILKEQLENYELPYENGAWEQFSKRLDGTPSTPFYRKWWFAASVGTVLVGSATFFALSSKEQTTQQQVAQSTEAVSSVTDHSSSTSTTKTTNDRKSQSETFVIDPANANSTTLPEQSSNPFKQSGNSGHGSGSAHCSGVPPTEPGYGSNPPISGQQGTPAPADHFIQLQLPSSVCLNESFTIENPNEQAIRITYPNGKTKTLQGKQSLEVHPSHSGTISVETGRSTESILVNEPNGELYINVDASLLYENGIPTLKFDVSGTENGISWESNVAARTSDRNMLIVHPFTEHEVTVKAITQDQNGCKVTETEKIQISKPYNLLAPTGFTPSSGDVRTNTFIPLALTMRDTPFEMTIMDPNNMTVLYTTSDASQGWNGTDGRSGQQVQIGTTWLWKVVMKKPLPGEPSEYRGLITVAGK